MNFLKLKRYIIILIKSLIRKINFFFIKIINTFKLTLLSLYYLKFKKNIELYY